MQSWKALNPIKIDTADDAIWFMHDKLSMDEVRNDWTYDLKDPGKNFWYECCLCNRQMKFPVNGRTKSAFCEKCWVFLQGYYWFSPTCFKDRPDPCAYHPNK